jgi:hypothetical protein
VRLGLNMNMPDSCCHHGYEAQTTVYVNILFVVPVVSRGFEDQTNSLYSVSTQNEIVTVYILCNLSDTECVRSSCYTNLYSVLRKY